MQMTVLKLSLTTLGLLGAVDAASPAGSPLSYFAQFGIAGLLCFILWYVLAKTLPTMTQAHTEQLKQMSDANSANLKQFTDVLEKVVAK